MIKANELRMGNYLYHDISIDDIEIIQVKIGDLALIDCGTESFEPIPLTEDWLRKFRFFPPKDDIYVTRCCDYAINIKTGDFFNHSEVDGKLIWIRTNKIKYVHQLQNLYFALTGEELTLKEVVS